MPDTDTEDASIPSGLIVDVDGNFDVRNVCNYGTIRVNDATPTNGLNIEHNLLNEGVITSTGTDPEPDIRFVDDVSEYRGSGTNDDADYAVLSGDLTLQANLSCRSMRFNADADLGNYTLTLKRDLTHDAGTITANNAKLVLDGPCLSCVDNAIAQDLFLNAVPNLAWSKIEVNKSNGAATMIGGNMVVNDSLLIRNGNFDQGPHQLSGTAAALQTGGGWRSTAVAGPQPFIDGPFDLQNGFVLFEGATNKIIKGLSYHELRFAGTGVHNLTADAEVRSLLNMRGDARLNTGNNRLYGAGGITFENDPSADPELYLGTITTAPLPELTGAYTNLATDGKIALDGTGEQFIKPLTLWRLGFEGPGVKNLTGNLTANESVRFDQNGAVTPGSYVNADRYILALENNSPVGLEHASNGNGGHGHVVGRFRRAVDGTNIYVFPIGADGSSPLFYERAHLEFSSDYASITHVTGRFSDIQPTPYDIDDVTDPSDGLIYAYLEDDGFWEFVPNDPSDNSGQYTMEVFPSGGWSFASPQYALLKTQPWAFHGSSRESNTRRNGYTEFSGFGFGIQDNPLPVEASPLAATPVADAIEISWHTFSERNNAGFALQRTLTPQDAASFATIAELDAKGTRSGTAEYLHLDTDVQPDVTYYYRYVQLDFDGTVTHSNIASARFSSDLQTRLSVYPNPFQSRMHFDLLLPEATDVELTVYDVTGRVIYATGQQPYEAGRQLISWEDEQLAAGMYHYTLSTTNGQNFSGKLVKE